MEELKGSISALEELGCKCTGMVDHGQFGYIIGFEKGGIKFRIVKDRGTWYLDGENEELKTSPSRKSRRKITQDAIDWIAKKDS